MKSIIQQSLDFYSENFKKICDLDLTTLILKMKNTPLLNDQY